MNYCRIDKKLVNEKSRKNSTFLYYRKVRHRVIFNNKFKNTKNKKEAT